MRKREVLLSRISVYITVLMVSCHTLRIIPTVWEIVQTFKMDTDTQVWDSQDGDGQDDTKHIVELLMASMGGRCNHHLSPGAHYLLLPIFLHILFQAWG